MNIIAKKIKPSFLIFAVLAQLLMFAFINAHAQKGADKATKEITAAMDSSANEWNKGHLEAFMSMYDPSATMMSHCLFPDTGKQYNDRLARPLHRSHTHLGNTSDRNGLNPA